MKRKLLLIVASMLISGAIFAQDFYWEGWDYHAFQRHMNIIGRAYFDGELQSRPNIEIATFVDGQLRGTKYLVEPYPNVLPGEYYVWNGCYYDNEGETFTFMAYDHDNGILYDLCDTELIGQQNGYGNMDNPLQMHFTRTVEPTYGPEYPWVPSTAYSGEGMSVTAQIKINGQLVDRASYELGAFCGDECRSTSGVQGLDDWTDIDLGYFAFMNIMGNNGDIINFYLHDLQNNCNFAGICTTTIELVNGDELGVDIMGGDIFVLNFQTEQTFTKEIAGYTTEKGGYYLIASPIGEVNPNDVTNMMENDIDLYYFDQNASDGLEWINIRDGNTNLISGKGYLYANSGDVTLVFTGYPYDGDGVVVLSKNAENNPDGGFEGWNLVGNPFAQIAYVSKPFYTMNDDGSEIISVTDNTVEALQGIFVVANEDGETVTFSTEPSKAQSQIVLNVTRNRGNAIDRAIVRFGEGDMLPKFMLNNNNTKVYIPQDNREYAMVRGTDAGELPVNFKAAQNGTYTICVNTEDVDVNYLHLIDNQTGADINLLQTPSYSFDALTTDYASRFKLVFSTGVKTENMFSFYSNGNWIINNEGSATLQVVDAMGRIMSSEEISGCVSKHIEAAPGVYMLRLINGNDMKVQKVVIK